MGVGGGRKKETGEKIIWTQQRESKGTVEKITHKKPEQFTLFTK
jgi:hypothetical protein